MARDAAGGVGGARRVARRHLMATERRRLSLRNVALITAIAIGVLVSVVALIRWDLSRECVRWSTRFDASRGGIYRTEVCAEFRPRQDLSDTVDPRGPKGEVSVRWDGGHGGWPGVGPARDDNERT